MKSVRHGKKLSIEGILWGASVALATLSMVCFMVYTTELHYAYAEDGDEDLGYDITSANASVTVGTACTFTSTVTAPHTATIANGINSTDIGTTVLNTTCNDTGGYALYVIGYTGDEYGATDLAYTSLDGNTTNTDYDIPTGTATSGNTSNWSMKLSPVAGTTTATIENGYSNYSIVPDDYTKVATLNTITDPGTSTSGSSVSTTYQAYISPTQPAGTYAGKVKYTVVHPSTAPAPEIPPTYMQDTAIIKSKLINVGDTMQAVDKRDGQEYTVARLADNKIWMTKNLNLAGGTAITSELSNVPDNYTLPTANGFQSGNKLPASSTSGFNNDTKAFVYNSTKTSGTNCSRPGCYSYYSWTAATAGSGFSITADNTDAPYSICPKGWKLPNSRSTVAGNSDFYKLAIAYGMDPSSTYQSTSNFYNQAGPGTTPNFLLTGGYSNGSFYGGGSYGRYWSSTSNNSTSARYLYFNSSDVISASNYSRRFGNAVRCIAE